jgi:putative membrane protein
MLPFIQAAFKAWELPVSLTASILLMALLYLRGWFRLRVTLLNVIPAWRVNSFLLGLFLIWVAVGSPLAAFDEAWLTVHMMQHLLLMTIAPPLILLGSPLMPILHGLPKRFVQTVLGPIFRFRSAQRLWRAVTQPAFCWLAAAAALVGWHIPAAFTLGLRSEAWHVVEHVCFLVTGLLFWWPVIQPWPSVARWSRWSMLLYLFLATLPCDILSGFLVFCERVVYPVYFSTSPPSGLSVLEDQQCAGALMWTCITIVYFVVGTIFITQLLSSGNSRERELVRPGGRVITLPAAEPLDLEIAQ